MDLGQKAHMSQTMLDMRDQQPAIHLDRNVDTPSPNGDSSDIGLAPKAESHSGNAASRLSANRVSHTGAHGTDAAHLRTTSDSILDGSGFHNHNGDVQLSSDRTPEGLPCSSHPPFKVGMIEHDTESRDAPPHTGDISYSPNRKTGINMSTIDETTIAAPSATQSVPPPASSTSVAEYPSPAPSTTAPDRPTVALRLATLPAPMMANYNAKGSARLTPSIVTRQPPMPILNLPTLPPPTPTPTQSARPRRQAPLRSIPALPMRGPSEHEQEVDHDNSTLMDSDEEDDYDMFASAEAPEIGVGSDEEDGEDLSEMSSPALATHPSRADHQALPQVDTSSLNLSFLEADNAGAQRATVYFTPSADVLPTPLARLGTSSVDYFTAKDREHNSPSRTPRLADYHAAGPSRTPGLGHGLQIVPMPAGSPRPGLYHHGSRSMVDLLSISRKGKDKMATPTVGAEISERRRSKVSPGPPTMPKYEHAQKDRTERMDDDHLTTPTLRRRRSLPTYKLTSDPPPYPSFHPRRGPEVQPRDEEGVERLPLYTNSIHLRAIMPRKVEFSAPGVQARDRKWRRVLCVLEGTAFKVYKCPPGASGVSAIEEWWENKVGVGDITTVNPGAVTSTGIRVSAVGDRQRDREPLSKATDTSPTILNPQEEESNQPRCPPLTPPPLSRSKLHIASSLLHPTRSYINRGNTTSNNNLRSRLSIDTQRDDGRHSSPPISSRQSSDGNSSRSALSSGRISSSTSRTNITTPSPHSNDSSSFFSRSTRILSHANSISEHSGVHGHAKIVEPSQKDLIRTYTLQHAESGLASDYTKRKNVVRVRMEGEQFLLQAHDVAAVIDWIEGIQAATNIALDLDERPMPKGPMFPRRRRRRRANAEGHENTQNLRVQPPVTGS
ncbi:hypothetical protein AcV7_003889 [Taiwanofungus camphoratus]|nr:hypothetical protein AcV7_003889 [Antrodia cinnamomea]